MSTPPSPRLGQPAVIDNKGRSKRRERPPALDFVESNGETRLDRDAAEGASEQPRLRLLNVGERGGEATESDLPRSTSATSSLDPYYFGAGTPSSESPVPPVPSLLPRTPEMGPFRDPVTPGKDPASIDRRGLVGVGELTTPRWARGERRDEIEIDEQVDEVDEDELAEVIGEEVDGHREELEEEVDVPDSPWTIEAIDGEPDEIDEFLDVQPLPRSLNTKRSMADESGGEEILYPRHPLSSQDRPPLPSGANISPLNMGNENKTLDANAGSPPSAFIPHGQRPRKRTSDEFELDHSGSLVSKRSSVSSFKEKDKTAARRHRSLGGGMPAMSPPARDKVKERRRDTLAVNIKHTRQMSTSSSSSSHGEPLHSRRLHTSDYSHLPPSPGSSSIQQFLRHASTGSNAASPSQSSPREQPAHLAANVAHSLLRGTQEGWSDMDDLATVEALRKLDGISGRTARARSSVGGHSRVNSTSRPSTPAGTSVQWEGVENRRASRTGSTQTPQANKDRGSKGQTIPHRQGLGLGLIDPSLEPNHNGNANNGKDELHGSPVPEKPIKKHGSIGQRSSFTPKRSSASSTTYTSTPTTSSRDSASLSAGTSLTSVSAISGRQSQSNSKARRNSAGSDISSHSVDGTSIRDRAASLAAATDAAEENIVPPVPPLPKDLSSLKAHAQGGSVSVAFPAFEGSEERERARRGYSDRDDAATLNIPTFPSTPSKQHFQPVKSATPTTSAPQKTPSKKWSFTNPLGKKLVSSPSQSSMKDSGSSKSAGLALSPRALSFTGRKATSKDQPSTPTTVRKRSGETWASVNPDAMASASSLASLSSIGSVHPVSPSTSAPPPTMFSKTPDHLAPSRPETASSSSTNLTASMPPIPQHTPLSPTSSIRRGPSTKRLTPSSIPFFRRSSSQSMQMPPPDVPSTSPTYSSSQQSSSTYLRPPSGLSPTKDIAPVSVPGSSHKKSSVLSLGLPSLLKGSSSRRSLHSDKEKSDAKSAKEEARHARDAEKEKHKKDDKDRSESRISVLMGRKRGKTLSSAQPKKPEPVALPPMQMSALPAATAQRVASLKSGSTSSLSSTQSTPKGPSRLTSQTVSSLQKQSDASLRITRNVLPTIAGSPSVGTLPHHSSKEPPPLSSLNSSSALSKETPTKIPRISSRSSATNSPTAKASGAGRRASVIIGGSSAAPSRGTSPSAGNDATEFGVLENGQAPKGIVGTTSQRHSVRASPSTSSSRVPRQAIASTSSVANGTTSRKNRESMSFAGLRKSSTGSVASITAVAATQNEPQTTTHHRFSALSPSKGLKLLSPKISLPSARSSTISAANQSISQTMASPTRQTRSTPSPVLSIMDEEELLGDEEMLQYIKRQQAKKLANGASQRELDELLRFPEPIRPVSPVSPAAILKSSRVQHLSEYECKEILEYPSVYYIGPNSDKKPATLDNSTNNHGYDDERGDYLVVAHDHLAYRYETLDTLGKGSFGQVLHCRDHCTGESVAIKIIRNKKRFHHQALVEIKILDSLRKWDQEEKHHVIKMTEHFYFRGHLCIAMELLSINLYELIKANGFVGFSTALIRRFTSQMLQSLALMRHHRIVHCDLKPENVLLRHPAKSAIKVIDFGSSCFEHEKIYTYIQSRFYRSPEVILGMSYHMAIDMWSLGCILAELYTGFPIFPGENEQEQLSCIMEVLGVPDKDFINRSSRKRLFFDTTGAPRPVVNSKGRRRRPGSKTLAQVLRCDDDSFVDFIGKCLAWDPERRLKPQSALRHPFVLAGKRSKATSPSPGAAKSLLNTASASGSRSSKTVTETPKKSLISAPTPLTARSSRISAGVVPTTPSSSGTVQSTLGSSSRSYRAAQTQSLSYHSSHSSRTMLAK